MILEHSTDRDDEWILCIVNGYWQLDVISLYKKKKHYAVIVYTK